MNRRDFLERWGLSGLKLNLGFLEGKFTPQDSDGAAAWELQTTCGGITVFIVVPIDK